MERYLHVFENINVIYGKALSKVDTMAMMKRLVRVRIPLEICCGYWYPLQIFVLYNSVMNYQNPGILI